MTDTLADKHAMARKVSVAATQLNAAIEEASRNGLDVELCVFGPHDGTRDTERGYPAVKVKVGLWFYR